MTALDEIRLRGSDYPYWIRLVLRRIQNWKSRSRIRALTEYDSHMLEDMGVTREEVFWAARLPLTVNAAWELRHRSRKRRLAERPLR